MNNIFFENQQIVDSEANSGVFPEPQAAFAAAAPYIINGVISGVIAIVATKCSGPE